MTTTPMLSTMPVPDPRPPPALEVMNAKHSGRVPSRICGMRSTITTPTAPAIAFASPTRASLRSEDLLTTYPASTNTRNAGKSFRRAATPIIDPARTYLPRMTSIRHRSVSRAERQSNIPPTHVTAMTNGQRNHIAKALSALSSSPVRSITKR